MTGKKPKDLAASVRARLMQVAQASGEEFQCTYANVAMDARGDYVVAWTSDGQDGSGLGVYAQQFDAGGNRLGSEFQLNTYTAGDQAAPAVAMNAAGDFTAVWNSLGQDGDGYGVYTQRYVAPDSFVINSNDSGPGSLRQALLDIVASSGHQHTIEFAIPNGPQTIYLLTALPPVTDPLTVALDATQDITIDSTTSTAWDAYAALTKTGSGRLTLSETNSVSGDMQVQDGTLQLNEPTTPTFSAGVSATISGTGSLELAGPVSALTRLINLRNNSTAAAGIRVLGTHQAAGGIDGTGNTTVADGADLTASHIIQGALIIGGTAENPATVTIAASDASGNPLTASVSSEATPITETGPTTSYSSSVAVNAVSNEPATGALTPSIASASPSASGLAMLPLSARSLDTATSVPAKFGRIGSRELTQIAGDLVNEEKRSLSASAPSRSLPLSEFVASRNQARFDAVFAADFDANATFDPQWLGADLALTDHYTALRLVDNLFDLIGAA